MSYPPRDWNVLDYLTQKRLYNSGDPRVPVGWKPKPSGRPVGYKMTDESKAKMRTTKLTKLSPETQCKKAAEAVKVLLEVYGSKEAVLKALQQ